ncbi:hypothetical protein R3Q06_17565 [Rhodococcus erythropolis]|uniref:hypothetical protein n=1 Tax=Rhodococcus erythropolis TaxID=1833 RepID=UPI002949BA34|nr:hypothetical protein [Rhodococcus erythropolis]MDV6275307.1 hypothetical protein [Rhodococcus erythropolis]
MPSDDDFADYENTAPEADALTADEVALLAKFRAEKRDDDYTRVEADYPDVVAPTVDEEDIDENDEVAAAEEALRIARKNSKKGNRKQRRAEAKSAGKIPANAPKPQDHQKANAARKAEASDSTIVLTLWGEEIRVNRSALIDSWDWQLGAIGKNPLHMVKGLLGDQKFFWFCARSQAEGKVPMDAAAEIMTMFAEESGVGTTGNS